MDRAEGAAADRYRLRAYAPGDEPHVFTLVREVLAAYGLKTHPEVTDSDLRDIGRSYVAGGGVFKVIECEGRIVGSYGLYRLSPSACELRKMYLYPEHRRRGLGKRMMDDAVREARALGCSEMTLETNSCLVEAVALYRAYGFREFAPLHLSDRCDVAMRRTI